MCTQSRAPQANKTQNNKTHTTNINKSKKSKILNLLQGFVDVKSFGLLSFWTFRFSGFWIFAVVHRCLRTVMDKWAKCAFPRVVGWVSVYIYICICTAMYIYIYPKTYADIDSQLCMHLSACLKLHAQALLGGSWDLVSTSHWACSPTYDWGNLDNATYRESTSRVIRQDTRGY